jgi:hypothetical protein
MLELLGMTLVGEQQRLMVVTQKLSTIIKKPKGEELSQNVAVHIISTCLMTQKVRVIHLIGLITKKNRDSSIDKVAGYELDVLAGQKIFLFATATSSGSHVTVVGSILDPENGCHDIMFPMAFLSSSIWTRAATTASFYVFLISQSIRRSATYAIEKKSLNELRLCLKTHSAL